MTDPRCGTPPGYQAHWENGTPRCRPCMDAQAAWQRNYEKRRYLARGPLMTDGTGTRRRLQALAVMGWRQKDIADQVDTATTYIGALMVKPGGRVRLETAAKVAALYDRWWNETGPSTSTAKRARGKGWLPPLAWDDDTIDDPSARPSRMTEKRPAFDEIAVQRAMRGSEVHLRPVERAEVVRRLTDLRLSTVEIAERLRVTERSVTRHRSAMNSAEKAS